MKTVTIFIFLVFLIILLIFITLKKSNIFKYKEKFVVRKMEKAKDRCIRSALDENRMTRKMANTPACFFYDIDNENENILSISGEVRNRTDDIIRKSVVMTDTLDRQAKEGIKNIEIMLRSDELSNFNKNILETNKQLTDDKKKTTVILNRLNTKSIYLDESSTLNRVQLAIAKKISESIDRVVKNTTGNIGTALQNMFTSNHKETIMEKISALIYDKINDNLSGDINNMINNLVEKNNLDKVVTMQIQNTMLEDKAFSSYMKSGNTSIKIGDFVYFKHKLSQNNAELYADNETQREIIVGGKVCSIDPVSNMVKLNYLFTTNPNFNSRATQYKYDTGVNGLPKWYINTDTDLTDKCGAGPFKNAACNPNQWSSDRDDWVRQFVGGFDRSKNEMACGVGPRNTNDYPSTVNIAILSKDLQKLIDSCQTDKLQIKPNVGSLPKPKYSPFENIRLPTPNYQDLPPPNQVSKEQLDREKLIMEAEKKLAAEQEKKQKALLARLESRKVKGIQRKKKVVDDDDDDEPQKVPGMAVQPKKKPVQQIKPQLISGKLSGEKAKPVAKPLRNEEDLVNRCLNANKDDAGRNAQNNARYITNSSGSRFRIVNGNIMMGPKNAKTFDEKTDMKLDLPKGIKAQYLFRKQNVKDKILAYGQDNKWYLYMRNPESGKSEFVYYTKTEIDDDKDLLGEIDPNQNCVKGNNI